MHHPRCAERLRGHGRAWIKGRGAARRERGRGEGVGSENGREVGASLEKIQVCTARGRKARHNFWGVLLLRRRRKRRAVDCRAAIEALPRCQSPGRMSLNPDLLLRMPKAAVYHGTDDAGEFGQQGGARWLHGQDTLSCAANTSAHHRPGSW